MRSGPGDLYGARIARRDSGRDGDEGLHPFQFLLCATHYGSLELSASSAEVTLATLRLRKGARFVYEYDLYIP